MSPPSYLFVDQTDRQTDKRDRVQTEKQVKDQTDRQK